MALPLFCASNSLSIFFVGFPNVSVATRGCSPKQICLLLPLPRSCDEAKGLSIAEEVTGPFSELLELLFRLLVGVAILSCKEEGKVVHKHEFPSQNTCKYYNYV